MQDLIINEMSDITGFPESRGGNLRARTRRNGDVEILKSRQGDEILLGVVPKEKRAELAQFLVSAE